MKVLVMGSGGVGGYYGGILSRTGHDVTLVARGQHLEAIRRNGLRVESVHSGDFTVRTGVTDRPNQVHTAELVLFCVKSYDNDQAIELIRPAVGPETSILTLQNGIGSGDQIAAALGPARVLLGVTSIDSQKRKSGVVAETGEPPRIVFGEEDGRITDRAVAIRDAMDGAGVPIELSTNVMKALWEKLVRVCAWSGMICVTRTFFPEILETPQAAEMTTQILQEAAAVARAKGVALADNFAATVIEKFRAVKGTPVSSMFTDLRNEGRLEVAVLNGAISRIGQDVGVPTPVNDFITACLMVADNAAQARG